MKSSLIRSGLVSLLVSLSSLAMADPPAPVPTSPPSNEQPAGTPPSPAKPDVATLLFTTPMWGKAPVGAKIHYNYEKTTASADLGKSFKDQIVLTLGAGDDVKSRTVDMQLFSGMNRLPAGPFRSDEQNPVLLVVLEDNVQELSRLFKANPRYLKNAIRKAWRDDAKIEPAEIALDGKQVHVTKITVTPFTNDAEADRMKGLQSMTYVVEISPDVPGTIAAIDISARGQDKTLFAETLRFATETTP